MAFVVAVGCAFGLVSSAAASQDASGVYTPVQGVTTPRVVKEVKPQYTNEAKAAGIQGAVELDVVVLEDGSVGDVKVTKSLDTVHGLDDEAVKAMKQWVFEPGKKDGKAVPVRVNVEMTFTLK
jgi:protein TonB